MACVEASATPKGPLVVSIAASEPIAVREVGGRTLTVLLASSAPVPVRDAEDKSFIGPEWSLVWVTALLAAFTAGLFAWTRKLANDAAREAKSSAAIADKALGAAQASAQASAAAVDVMQGQLKAANASVQANEAVLKVMQQQLAAANAPKIALRLATVEPRTHVQGPCIVSVKLLLENTGQSKAVVREAGIYLDWQTPNQPRQPAKVKPQGEFALPVGTTIEAGQIHAVTVSQNDFLWPANSAFDVGTNGIERQMYLSGRVVYGDEAGLLPPKTTAFYRVYKGGTDSVFDPIGNPGVEYTV